MRLDRVLYCLCPGYDARLTQVISSPCLPNFIFLVFICTPGLDIVQTSATYTKKKQTNKQTSKRRVENCLDHRSTGIFECQIELTVYVSLKKLRKTRSGERWFWWLCLLWLADRSLGEFTPGNWGEWQTCHLGTQTRQRLCQNFPPVYSGLNSSYQLYDTKKCGKWLLKGWNGGMEYITI